jgi:hypothetical protein
MTSPKNIFRASKQPKKFRTQKARKKTTKIKKNETSKMKVVCDPIGIDGWPLISTSIGGFQLESSYFETSLYNLNVVI